MVTAFSVVMAENVQNHPAVKYARYFASKKFDADKESERKVGREALVRFLNKEGDEWNPDVGMAIFELMFQQTQSEVTQKFTLQAMAMRIGGMACRATRNKEQCEIFVTITLNLIRDIGADGRKVCDTLINVAVACLRTVATSVGHLVYALVTKWTEEGDNMRDLSKQCKKEYAVDQMNLLLKDTEEKLGWLPLSADKWIEADKAETIQITEDDDKEGWKTLAPCGTAEEPPNELLIAAWNMNGFETRLNNGDFAKFITAARPDLVALLEVKCGPQTLKGVAMLHKGLAALGYRHVLWNWCVELDMKREYGTMVFSRYDVQDVKYGIADPIWSKLDTQGRCITTTLGRTVFIQQYAPSPSLQLEDDRRVAFDKEFRKYLEKVTEKAKADNMNVVLSGDVNVIAEDGDIDMKGPKERKERYKRLTEGQRKRHKELMADLGWASAGAELQEGPPVMT